MVRSNLKNAVELQLHELHDNGNGSAFKLHDQSAQRLLQRTFIRPVMLVVK